MMQLSGIIKSCIGTKFIMFVMTHKTGPPCRQADVSDGYDLTNQYISETLTSMLRHIEKLKPIRWQTNIPGLSILHSI